MSNRTACILMAIGTLTLVPPVASAQQRGPVPPPPLPPAASQHPGQPQRQPAKDGTQSRVLLKSYSPPDNSFQVLYPADWKVVPGHVPGNAVTFVDPTEPKPGEGKHLISVSITGPGNKGIKLEDVGKGEVDAAPKKLPGFQRIVDQGMFTLNDRKAFHLVCDMQVGGAPIRTFQYTFLQDDVPYTVSLIGPPEKVKRDEELATQITGMFKVNSSPKFESVTAANSDAAPSPTAATNYENAEFGISAELPAGWVGGPTKLPDTVGIAAAFAVWSRPASAGKIPQTIVITASHAGPGEKINLMELETASTRQAEFKDLKRIEAADTKVGDSPARRAVFGGIRKDEHEGRMIVVGIEHGRDVIAIAAGTPVEDFDAVRADVDKVIASIKFTKPGARTLLAQATDAHPATPDAQPAKPAASNEPQRWEAPDKSYSFILPAGWQAKAAEGGSTGGAASDTSPLFTGPAEGSERPDAFQVVVGPATLPNAPSTPPPTPAPPANSRYARTTPAPSAAAQNANNPANKLRNWMKSLRDGLSQKGTDVKVTSENPTSLGGAQGVRFVFDSKNAGGEPTRTINYVVEKGDKQYALSFSFDPKRMSKVIPVEQALSRSFTVGPAPQKETVPTASATPTPAAPTGAPETDAGGHKIATDATPFEDKLRGFRLTYPAGWGEAGAKPPGVTLALGKRASAGKVAQMLMVVSNIVDPGEHVTLKVMEQMFTRLASAGAKDAKVVEATDIKLGGEPARRVVMTATRESDAHPIRAVAVFALHDRLAVGLFGSAPIEDANAFTGDFDKIAGSFEFTDAPAGGATAAKSPTLPVPRSGTAAEPAPATPAAATGDALTIPEAGVSLTAPTGWTVRKAPAPGIPLMLISATTKPGARPSTITVGLEPTEQGGAKPPPMQIVDDAVKAFKAGIAPDARVLESSDPKIGVARARQVIVAGHRNPGNADIRQIILCFYGSNGLQAVTLTGESPTGEFDALKSAMEQISGSITLKPPTLIRKPQ